MRRILYTVLFMMSLQLSAYEFTQDFNAGFYWAKFPIKMSIVGRNATEAQQLFLIAKSCEREWENALGMDIWDFGNTYVVSASSTSENDLHWSSTFAQDTGRDPSSTLAVTIRYTQGTYLTKSQIILNGLNSALLQNFAGTLRKVVLHELGHTIGLDHSDQPAIMQAYISSLGYLTSDDEDGASKVLDEALYRQRTGYVSPNASVTEEVAACGTVGEAASVGRTAGGFLSSFLIGFLGLFFRKIKKLVSFRE